MLRDANHLFPAQELGEGIGPATLRGAIPELEIHGMHRDRRRAGLGTGWVHKIGNLVRLKNPATFVPQTSILDVRGGVGNGQLSACGIDHHGGGYGQQQSAKALFRVTLNVHETSSVFIVGVAVFGTSESDACCSQARKLLLSVGVS